MSILCPYLSRYGVEMLRAEGRLMTDGKNAPGCARAGGKKRQQRKQ